MSTRATTIDPERQMLGEVEMVGQDRWEEIRRRAGAGASIRAIARELDVDRKTVRRCLRQTEWKPYERAAPADTLLATHASYLRRRAADVGYSAPRGFMAGGPGRFSSRLPRARAGTSVTVTIIVGVYLRDGRAESARNPRQSWRAHLRRRLLAPYDQHGFGLGSAPPRRAGRSPFLRHVSRTQRHRTHQLGRRHQHDARANIRKGA